MPGTGSRADRGCQVSTFLYGLATGVVLTCVAWIALGLAATVAAIVGAILLLG